MFLFFNKSKLVHRCVVSYIGPFSWVFFPPYSVCIFCYTFTGVCLCLVIAEHNFSVILSHPVLSVVCSFCVGTCPIWCGGALLGESCVENIAKKDVVAAGGSLQLRAGQKLGSEVAIHAMYSLFQANFTDAALQIGALNTETWHDSFITCGIEIKLAKGTTQQDPSGMGLYALHVQPLICKRHHA